jgi:hypothetical protein
MKSLNISVSCTFGRGSSLWAPLAPPYLLVDKKNQRPSRGTGTHLCACARGDDGGEGVTGDQEHEAGVSREHEGGRLGCGCGGEESLPS